MRRSLNIAGNWRLSPQRWCKGNHLKELDLLILGTLLAKEFLLDFFGTGNIVNAIICAMIVYRLSCDRWLPPKPLVFGLAICPMLLFIAFIMGGSPWIALKNTMRIAQVQIYALYLYYLSVEQRDTFKKIYKSAGLLLNGILLINIVIMLIQYYVPGSFLAVGSGPEISAEDKISGLLAYGSTHAVALYTSFVVCYNINWISRAAKNVKPGLTLLTFLIVGSSLFVATLNDNKALIFFLFVSITLMFMIWVACNPRKALRFGIPILFIVVVSCIFAYCSLPAFHIFVEENVLHVIEISRRAFRTDAFVNGSDERIKIILFALTLPTSWQLGVGMGKADLYQAGYFGFNHFGMNDYGSIIILGGIWAYLSLIAFYSYCIAAVNGKTQEERGVLILASVFLLLIGSVFTQIFTQVRIAIPELMIGWCFYNYWDETTNNKRDNR